MLQRERTKVKTPIADFVKNYAKKDMSRFHMPGHKGRSFVGCELYDITEVNGADALYEAEGIIGESEANATKLFGTAKTVYSTEGSSQCIRSMLYLAVNYKKSKKRPYIIASRNVHKSFLYAAALIDFDVVWLWPKEMHSLCSCKITAEQVEEELKRQEELPAAVYLTSPDYLGSQADLKAIAEVCHKYNTILAVDNAHGSYLHFLEEAMHPIDLGADICCDSAHKTLPVLTGGAYLQISKNAPTYFCENAKQTMALFGSTSPSYLTMISLDLCNDYLEQEGREKLKRMVSYTKKTCDELRKNGWTVEETEPLKITIKSPDEITGITLAKQLREGKIECEYADDKYVVFMISPENSQYDLDKIVQVLGKNSYGEAADIILKPVKCEQRVSIRQAIFAEHERISATEAVGRVCGFPTVGCPPAIPIAVSGEVINEAAIKLFEYYGIMEVDVTRKDN